jgi:hypothetical protein
VFQQFSTIKILVPVPPVVCCFISYIFNEEMQDTIKAVIDQRAFGECMAADNDSCCISDIKDDVKAK